MRGPEILVRSLQEARIPDKFGNTWRYHSRSDRHSKIACWGILFDLLENCPLFAKHADAGSVVFGINHEMRDFRVNRKKDLDLVISTPRDGEVDDRAGFVDLVDEYGIVLDAAERRALSKLPKLRRGSVGAVQVALEAKACMTAHVRALPRLYDELNSSHLTIHGAMDMAIAVGFVMVNVSESFLSSDLNKHDLGKLPPNVSQHRQPADAVRVVDKVLEIPRRGRTGEEGFDALALVLLSMRNDNSPVVLVSKPPSPAPGGICHYDMMIQRVAQLYESRFPRV